MELVEKVLADLDEPLTIDEIAGRLPGYRAESVRSQVESLVREGVLVAGAGGNPPSGNRTFAALLDEVGFGAPETLARLAECKVAIFGLEAHGAHVAQILADAGVGHLVLADPFPFEPAHHTLTPVREPHAVWWNEPRAGDRQAGRQAGAAGHDGRPGSTFDRDRVRALAEGCKLLVVCWDRGFHAAHHWANEAALEWGVPALFSDLRATSTFAGPLLPPGRSACWMCYRMRALACVRTSTSPWRTRSTWTRSACPAWRSDRCSLRFRFSSPRLLPSRR